MPHSFHKLTHRASTGLSALVLAYTKKRIDDLAGAGRLRGCFVSIALLRELCFSPENPINAGRVSQNDWNANDCDNEHDF